MVFEKVKVVLADLLSVNEDDITLDSAIVDDLGADSLDLVDAIGVLNDEFGVDIPDEQLEHIKTVGDLVEYIEENSEY